ncbi:olfactory receptor 11a1-like [Limosa lapponica baueri]|uniref:Olfactory receptor 11a1-like n=1 Tax=Limosa lapponica baueri TaxID=1758121 RepID=A0A2I0TQF5_LIMLA|nr:olfactory receptor 11a1-like [Limosa lapponica baueri]
MMKNSWVKAVMHFLLANGECGNKTVITTFLLLEFGNIPEVQSFLFLLFLVIYIVTVICNILIFVLVVADWHLHKPMYFFLCNLSCLETCYSSTILPRMLSSFLTGDKSISIGGCITQFYFFGFLAVTESFLLSVMSYDRYLAVCKPLHYRAVMNSRCCLQLVACLLIISIGGCITQFYFFGFLAVTESFLLSVMSYDRYLAVCKPLHCSAVMNSRCCLQLVAWSWVNGFLVMAISCFLISQHSFCGPKLIDHFFCDFTPVIKLSCCDTSLTEMLVFILSSVCALPPFLLTLVSYTCIIATVLRMSSIIGMQKAFSTCFSHLIVITVFYGSLVIVYILPKTRTLKALNKFVSVFYTVVTPLLNPLIYSLRNREGKDALSKVLNKCEYFLKLFSAIHVNLLHKFSLLDSTVVANVNASSTEDSTSSYKIAKPQLVTLEVFKNQWRESYTNC